MSGEYHSSLILTGNFLGYVRYPPNAYRVSLFIKLNRLSFNQFAHLSDYLHQ